MLLRENTFFDVKKLLKNPRELTRVEAEILIDGVIRTIDASYGLLAKKEAEELCGVLTIVKDYYVTVEHKAAEFIIRNCGPGMLECQCSACGCKEYIPIPKNMSVRMYRRWLSQDYWFMRKYCPNCGTKMEKENE